MDRTNSNEVITRVPTLYGVLHIDLDVIINGTAVSGSDLVNRHSAPS